jgi:hypothetical protein
MLKKYNINKKYKKYNLARGTTSELDKMEKGQLGEYIEIIPVTKSQMGPDPNTRERFDSLLQADRQRRQNSLTAHELFSRPRSEEESQMNEKKERNNMFREDTYKIYNNPLDDDVMDKWGYDSGYGRIRKTKKHRKSKKQRKSRKHRKSRK